MFQKKYSFLIKSTFFPNQKGFVLPLKIHATQHQEEHNVIFFPKSVKICWLSFSLFLKKIYAIDSWREKCLVQQQQKIRINVKYFCVVFKNIFVLVYLFVRIHMNKISVKYTHKDSQDSLLCYVQTKQYSLKICQLRDSPLRRQNIMRVHLK